MLLKLMHNNTEILTVREGRRFVLPNGDIVSPAYAGWSNGTYSLEEAIIEQVIPQPAQEDITITRLQAKAILATYNLLQTVEDIIAQQDFIVQLAWKEASVFVLSSAMIQSLKPLVKWPDGTDITEEQWIGLFMQAQNLTF
jgi:hypothetical protein